MLLVVSLGKQGDDLGYLLGVLGAARLTRLVFAGICQGVWALSASSLRAYVTT
jgi:hypothetical protein